MHKIRWDDLQYVHAVARHGTLSAAARDLGVNHATVLRRITALEAAQGVTLFDRPPGGYRLRPEGRDLLAALDQIGAAVERLERVMPTIGKDLDGSFRITTTDSIADLLMPRHLADLQRAHPRLDVELVVSNAPMDPRRPDAEITIRPALNLPDGLDGRLAAQMNFGPYSARNVPANARWLGLSGRLTKSPLGLWQADQPAETIGFSADSFLTLARMAEAGLGRAMLPGFVGAASDMLYPIEAAPTFQTNVWVAAHPDFMAGDRVRVVVDFLADAFAADPRLPG